MKVFNIKDFWKGWIIGDFEPSIFKNQFFEYPPKHTHKIATEVSYIIKGELIASGKNLRKGDMWIYEPNDIADVSFIKDTELIVIKWPSIPSDKYDV